MAVLRLWCVRCRHIVPRGSAPCPTCGGIQFTAVPPADPPPWTLSVMDRKFLKALRIAADA